MKRILLITIGIVLLFLCSTCRKEHISPVNQLVKDLFCFKEGSEWTYYDSVSQTMQKMVVTGYEITKLASMPEGGRKAYNFAEYIKMEVIVGNSKKETRLQAEVDQDNTLGEGLSCIYTPIGKPLYLSCDKNNNFTPSAIHLSTYTVNETTYSDVYVFNNNSITYYASKYVGFVRCECNKFDLVLIDKNVQQ